jgi:pyridoxine 4-dehydrogenase
VSNVSVDELARARAVVRVASVQNEYNIANRKSDDVVDVCARDGLGFLPWRPLGTRGGGRALGDRMRAAAARHQATPGEVALAWLLRRSPVMLPIPGTGSVAHLEENVRAADLRLSDDEYQTLISA